eukprot:89564-Chlamydomonas_euryale.AAC.3
MGWWGRRRDSSGRTQGHFRAAGGAVPGRRRGISGRTQGQFRADAGTVPDVQTDGRTRQQVDG